MSRRAAETGAGHAALVERAADVCKMDLVTETVGEFPELQGLMGRYYAEAQRFATLVTTYSRQLEKPIYVVTGGGPGIMEAANRGAYEAPAPCGTAVNRMNSVLLATTLVSVQSPDVL